MTATAGPPPIPGKPLDPPAKETPEAVLRLEDSGASPMRRSVRVVYRSFDRFVQAKATLLAAGTTYYLFLALFSVVALGYGVATAVGSDQLADYLTEALGEAFPGLVGDEGIDPDELRSVGQTASVIGLLALLYAGTGGVVAARRSLHLIYGAPKDPRNFFLVRFISLPWLIILGPLIGLSFVASSIAASWRDDVLDALNIDGGGNEWLLTVLVVALTLGINFLIVYLILANFGGIRPARKPIVIASLVGMVVIEILKHAMALILSFSVDKPQFGAFTAPIGVMLVLYLQSLVIYGCGSLVAGIAERRTPLAEDEATGEQDAAADEEATVPDETPSATESEDRPARP